MIYQITHMVISSVVFYRVGIDPTLFIPVILFTSFIICVLLRESTNGILKYILASIFIISFGVLLYFMELDYSPYNYIMPAVAIFGGSIGISKLVGSFYRDVRKIDEDAINDIHKIDQASIRDIHKL